MKHEMFAQHNTGALQKMLVDGVAAADELSFALLVHIIPALFLAASAFTVFASSFDQPLLAGVAWSGVNFYLWITIVLLNEKQLEREEFGETLTHLRGTSVDVLLNYEAVKSFEQEKTAAERVGVALIRMIETYCKARISHSWLDFAQSFVNAATRFGVLAIACAAVVEWQTPASSSSSSSSSSPPPSSSSWVRRATSPLTISQFIAVRELLERVFEPLSDLATKITAIVTALEELSELVSMMEDKHHHDTPEPEDGVDLAALPPSRPMLCKSITVVNRDPATGDVTTSETEICVKNPKRLSVEFKSESFTYPVVEKRAEGDKQKQEKEEGKQHKRFSSSSSSSDSDNNDKTNNTNADPRKKKGIASLSFSVPAGHSLGIVGQSGSFKSTVAKLLMGFYSDYEGEILVAGHDLRRCKNRRKAISIVAQETTLLDATIRENVMFGLPTGPNGGGGAEKEVEPITQEEVEHVMVQARLQEVVSSLPGRCDAPTGGQAGSRLSGGERQRIGIARCLLRKPRIMLLDEATSALDVVTEAAINKELQSFAAAGGRTTIVIAHRLSQVMSCDEIIVLDGGEMVEQGSHGDLLRKGGVYAYMWETQMQSHGGHTHHSPAHEPQHAVPSPAAAAVTE